MYLADASLRSDRVFAMRVATQKPLALRFAHESVLQDREIMLAAVQTNNRAMALVDDSLARHPSSAAVGVAGRHRAAHRRRAGHSQGDDTPHARSVRVACTLFVTVKFFSRLQAVGPIPEII